MSRRAVESEIYEVVISSRVTTPTLVSCSSSDSSSNIIVTAQENTICLWQRETNGCKLIADIKEMEMRGNGEIARVDCFCFRSQRQTQAGSNISRINWLVGAGLKDKSLKVYEVDPLNENPSENVNVKLTIPNAHDSYINDCKFLNFGMAGEQYIVSCSDDLTVRVWNVNSDSEKLTVEFRTRTTPISIATHPNHVEQFWVAEQDGTIHLFHLSSPVPLCTLSTPSVPFYQLDWNILDDKYIGGVGGGKWFVWNWRTKQLEMSGKAFSNVTGFSWSKTHPNLFSAHSSSAVYLWDTFHPTVGCLEHTQASRIKGVTWLSDAPCCVIASGGKLYFWNIKT